MDAKEARVKTLDGILALKNKKIREVEHCIELATVAGRYRTTIFRMDSETHEYFKLKGYKFREEDTHWIISWSEE